MHRIVMVLALLASVSPALSCEPLYRDSMATTVYVVYIQRPNQFRQYPTMESCLRNEGGKSNSGAASAPQAPARPARPSPPAPSQRSANEDSALRGLTGYSRKLMLENLAACEKHGAEDERECKRGLRLELTLEEYLRLYKRIGDPGNALIYATNGYCIDYSSQKGIPASRAIGCDRSEATARQVESESRPRRAPASTTSRSGGKCTLVAPDGSPCISCTMGQDRWQWILSCSNGCSRGIDVTVCYSETGCGTSQVPANRANFRRSHRGLDTPRPINWSASCR